MEKVFISKFDDSGKRIGTLISGIQFHTEEEKQKYLDEGYIEHSKEDWKLYIDLSGGDNGTGYIRDLETGKPVSAPPRIISKSEKSSVLKNEYSSELEEIKKAMLTAILNDDSELQNDLKNEFAELTAEYKSKLEEVIQDEN